MHAQLRLATIAALILMLSGPVTATSIKHVNLEEMMSIADRVFLGKVVEVRKAVVENRPVTLTTFTVTRAVKGNVGQTVTIKTLASNVPGQSSLIPGMPTFSAGQEVVVFLHGDSKGGFTSPVGLYQGRLDVVTAPGGGKQVRGAFSDSGLFRGMQTQWVKTGLLGAAAESPALKTAAEAAVTPDGRNEVDLNAFMKTLDKMAK